MLEIHNLVEIITAKLEPVYHSLAMRRQYAWWILEELIGKSRAILVMDRTIVLSSVQEQKLDAWLAMIIEQQMPIQYLIGHVPFGHSDILIEPPVLIPRPETEAWVTALIEQAAPIANLPLTIVDMCTGSGCIAIELASSFPNATVYGIDISAKALACAQKNSIHNNITNIRWVQSDLFSRIPLDLSIDILVSNPPYIKHSLWQTLDPSVRDWEDTAALVGGTQGSEIVASIIQQVGFYLRPNCTLQDYGIPQLTVEIDCTQALIVYALLDRAGFYGIRIDKDSAGRERCASAQGVKICGFNNQ